MRADGGALGCASLQLGTQYHGFCISELHMNFLLKVFDIHALALLATEKGEENELSEAQQDELTKLFE